GCTLVDVIGRQQVPHDLIDAGVAEAPRVLALRQVLAGDLCGGVLDGQRIEPGEPAHEVDIERLGGTRWDVRPYRDRPERPAEVLLIRSEVHPAVPDQQA